MRTSSKLLLSGLIGMPVFFLVPGTGLIKDISFLLFIVSFLVFAAGCLWPETT